MHLLHISYQPLLCLLDAVHAQSANRQGQAAEYYKLSLALDPMLWSSVAALCDMGHSIDPDTYYGSVPDLPRQAHQVRSLFETFCLYLHIHNSSL
jgi:hypothetical protein